MPKISVIVPVYKVEKYLNRCVDSILNQTFRDFELILVDDGSPDNCPAMCDEYAARDVRVVVIHKENGGLSDARNAGIDWAFKNSESEYLLFVDSDDFIKQELLAITYNAIIKQTADVVCFGVEMIYENMRKLSWGDVNIAEEQVFDYKNRFKPILAPSSIGDYAWNKLYKKELFKDIRYPKGLIFEDIYTTYKIFDKANKIVLIKEKLYTYVRRPDSITQQIEFNKNIYNMFYAWEEKYNYISKTSPEFSSNAIDGITTSILICLSAINKQNEQIDLAQDIEFFRNKANKYWHLIKKSKYVLKENKKTIKHLLKSYNSYDNFVHRNKKNLHLINYIKSAFIRVFNRKK